MKIKGILASTLLTVTLLTACQPGGASTSAGSGPIATEAGSNENSTPVGVVTVEHALGTTEVPAVPEQTVVFDYGLLDMLDALDVEVAALPKTQLPEALAGYQAESYVNAGSLQEPDYETLAELAPELILISERAEAHYGELSRLAPTVHFTTRADDYLAAMAENAKTLGEIFGREAEAAEAMAEITARAEAIRTKIEAEGETALILMANDGALSAFGPASRFGLIHSLGFQPIDSTLDTSTHGQNVTFEYVMEKDPDHIFVIDRAMIAGGENTAARMFDNELIRQTRAHQSGDIHYLDAFNWYVISGGFTSTGSMLDELEAAAE